MAASVQRLAQERFQTENLRGWGGRERRKKEKYVVFSLVQINKILRFLQRTKLFWLVLNPWTLE